ncbi:MAG TPA: nitronate monooxygenase [bacterium]|nr:nitronate monooxygenase [bacterium]
MANDNDDSSKTMSRRRALEVLGIGGMSLATSAILPSSVKAGYDTDLSLHTRLTREFGIRWPFVGAGMGFVAMPELVAAVSNAGGMGVLGNAIEPPPGTQILIQQIRQLTDRPFGVDFSVVDTPAGPGTLDAHIEVAAAERVSLVVFHFDLPKRDWVLQLQAVGTRVWAQVPSFQQAMDALDLGVDGIVAQGSEAGGHNRNTTTPLRELLREILRNTRKPVLASGGIVTGRDAARALHAGAEGVWVGSRLIASVEAHAHPEYKRRVANAGRGETVSTTMFGPELPDEPYRVLRNRVVNEWAGREDEIPSPPPPPATIGTTVLFPLTLRVPYTMPKFSAVVPDPETEGDFEEMGLPAGAGSHRIRSVLPAGRIVREMMHEAREALDDIACGRDDADWGRD